MGPGGASPLAFTGNTFPIHSLDSQLIGQQMANEWPSQRLILQTKEMTHVQTKGGPHQDPPRLIAGWGGRLRDIEVVEEIKMIILLSADIEVVEGRK